MKKYIKVIILSILLFLFYLLPSTLAPFDKNWYETLNKPIFTPPQIVFSIVWTILYALMAISAALILLTKAKDSKRFYMVVLALNYFFIQMYAYIQFQLKDISLAFVDVLLVLITSFVLYLTGSTINKKAANLLIPLIVWIIFAAFLQVGLLKYN